MTRSNLAVCFSPVIFRFSLEKKTNLKTKLDSSTSSYSKPSTANTNTPVTATTSTANILIESNSAQQKNPQQSQPNQQLLQQTSLPLEISLPLQVPTKSQNFMADITITKSPNSPVESVKITESSPTRKSSDSDITELKKEIVAEEDSVSTQQKNSFIASESSSIVCNDGGVGGGPLVVSQSLLQQQIHYQHHQHSSTSSKDKQNYKRKYSEKINKAASSIVNFGAELSSSKTTAFFSDSFKENLENMSKVIQLCVSDMIKYSMDLFTVSSRQITHITDKRTF